MYYDKERIWVIPNPRGFSAVRVLTEDTRPGQSSCSKGLSGCSSQITPRLQGHSKSCSVGLDFVFRFADFFTILQRSKFGRRF